MWKYYAFPYGPVTVWQSCSNSTNPLSTRVKRTLLTKVCSGVHQQMPGSQRWRISMPSFQMKGQWVYSRFQLQNRTLAFNYKETIIRMFTMTTHSYCLWGILAKLHGNMNRLSSLGISLEKRAGERTWTKNCTALNLRRADQEDYQVHSHVPYPILFLLYITSSTEIPFTNPVTNEVLGTLCCCIGALVGRSWSLKYVPYTESFSSQSPEILHNLLEKNTTTTASTAAIQAPPRVIEGSHFPPGESCLYED